MQTVLLTGLLFGGGLSGLSRCTPDRDYRTECYSAIDAHNKPVSREALDVRWAWYDYCQTLPVK